MAERRIVVALTGSESEFQRLQAEEASRLAAVHGLDVQIVLGGGYAIEQIHQIFRFIHVPEDQRPAAIVAEPISDDGMARLARNAARAGIGWVSMNSRSPWLAELRKEFPQLPLGSVSADQLAVGRLQGQQVRTLLPHGGRAFCIAGPSQHAASGERRAGLEEVLSEAGIDVTFAEGQWTYDSGARLVQSWSRLRTGDDLGFDVLVCQNDEMALGGAAVLAEHAEISARGPWATVPTLGVDGLPGAGRAFVDQGKLAATIVTPPPSGPAIELLARWLRTGADVPPEVLLDPTPYPEQLELARRAPLGQLDVAAIGASRADGWSRRPAAATARAQPAMAQPAPSPLLGQA